VRTFNKRGDQGETSLLYGGRVPKSSPRTEAYGTIDEAVSALGLARALSGDDRVRSLIVRFQRELFSVAAEMATDRDHYDDLLHKFGVIGDEQVSRIEGFINELEAEIEMPKTFVLPGEEASAAALDLARTIIRRCERRAVGLMADGLIQNPAILAYLNRLADFTFTLARYAEQKAAGSHADPITAR